MRLPTNFKAARFESEDHTKMLRDLERDIDGIRFDVGGEKIELPVKLKVHDSVFVPLAKWAMLMAGNYRCVTKEGMRPIKDAVHSDLDASRDMYDWVVKLCTELGADIKDLVPFEKYANAALSLGSPSSAARALYGGAPNIERVDRLVQCVARQRGLSSPGAGRDGRPRRCAAGEEPRGAEEVMMPRRDERWCRKRPCKAAFFRPESTRLQCRGRSRPPGSRFSRAPRVLRLRGTVTGRRARALRAWRALCSSHHFTICAKSPLNRSFFSASVIALHAAHRAALTPSSFRRNRIPRTPSRDRKRAAAWFRRRRPRLRPRAGGAQGDCSERPCTGCSASDAPARRMR